jgi:hypothetical protein
MKTQASLRLSTFSGRGVFFILKERKSTKMNTPPTSDKRNIGNVIKQIEIYIIRQKGKWIHQNRSKASVRKPPFNYSKSRRGKTFSFSRCCSDSDQKFVISDIYKFFFSKPWGHHPKPSFL